MAKKKKPDPLKTAPGLVVIRLQLPPEAHARFRVLAAASPQKDMANLAREIVMSVIERGAYVSGHWWTKEKQVRRSAPPGAKGEGAKP